ncbi:MAG: HAMP domain-containing sensor histidine kinase, partial [Oscillospiraceae bacterium]|nr:HAMP domain-containing sensor histidine kinase [Oscillospiraceae bacterium]
MIKKLRRKFICINMALVSAVLLIVFALQYAGTYRSQVNESYKVLAQAIEKRFDDAQNTPPKLEFNNGGMRPLGSVKPNFNSIPFFVALVDASGNANLVMQQSITVENDVLQQAVEAALQTNKTEGLLTDFNLRFLMAQTPEGIKIAFADRSTEQATLRHLLFISLGVGMAALVAFFLISLFLSSWALRPVEKAWSQQRRFVADASHELKTPLTVILANIGILQRHPDDTIARQIKWIDNTNEEAVRMKKLVDDLLFLAKSDDTKTTVVFNRVNLSDAVWNSVLPFESIAFERGLTLNSEITSDLMIQGNELQLKQLSAILIDNACKYAGEKGSITVTLKTEQDK